MRHLGAPGLHWRAEDPMLNPARAQMSGNRQSIGAGAHHRHVKHCYGLVWKVDRSGGSPTDARVAKPDHSRIRCYRTTNLSGARIFCRRAGRGADTQWWAAATDGAGPQPVSQKLNCFGTIARQGLGRSALYAPPVSLPYCVRGYRRWRLASGAGAWRNSTSAVCF